MARVLVACEYSGRVRHAFRRRGHDAWSCDILPAEDGPSGRAYHLQGSRTYQGVADAMAAQWGALL